MNFTGLVVVYLKIKANENSFILESEPILIFPVLCGLLRVGLDQKGFIMAKLTSLSSFPIMESTRINLFLKFCCCMNWLTLPLDYGRMDLK